MEDNKVLNTDEIRNKLEAYQTGVVEESEDEKIEPIPVEELQNRMPVIRPLTDRLRSARLDSGVAENYSAEALQAGYGNSRFDRAFSPEQDLEQKRAIDQTAFEKIGSGLAKMAVTAGTTAVNTTIGTVFGLGAGLYELAADTEGDGEPIRDALDAGVNNWLSNQMVKIQNWSEEVFPNYRTEQERSEKYQKEWYKHMGTANFIGDSILKNFGFTLGAMAGGVAWSKVIGKALSRGLANNIMKGAVAAAEGDAEISGLLQEAASAVKAGTATEAQAALARAEEAVRRGTTLAFDQEKILENVKAAARGINKMNAKLQLYGAAVGAMGEGTVEGIMAKNEFLEDYKAKLNRQYRDEYEGLEQEILNSGNKNWVETKVYNHPEFGLISRKELTDLGKKHLALMQQDVTEHYQNLNNLADEEAERLASTTFLLNLPILTASNIIQFGKMFGGGWQTARENLVKGEVRRVGQDIVGEYVPKVTNKVARGALNSLKVAGSEAFEEMAQGTVSSGAKQVAEHILTEFNDSGYDDSSIRSVRNWFADMYQGGKEYLGDIKNWQEGALGALTGLFGIPGRQWHGGVIGSIQEANRTANASQAAAETLNNIVNSKDFQDRWKGYIRHNKFDGDMQKAVINDDEYAYHMADDDQLISDIFTFAKQGKLDDLSKIVDEFANITVNDDKGAIEVRGTTTGETNTKENNNPEGTVESVKNQVKKIKDAIQDYKELYDALSSRAPVGSSDDFIDEMVFSAMHIKNSDRRFLTMLGETLDALDPVITAMGALDKNGNAAAPEEAAQRYKTLRDTYEKMFSGSMLPVLFPNVLKRQIDNSFDELKEIIKNNGDDELLKKVEDMQKLSEDRRNYFQKLQMMRDNKRQANGKTVQENFEEQKMTQEKKNEESDAAYVAEETKDLDSLDKVKQAYFEKDAAGRAKFLDTLTKTEDSNASVKNFMNIKRLVDRFKAYLDANPVVTDDMFVRPNMVDSAVNDLLRLAKSEEDIIKLPDNVFVSPEQFALAFQRPEFAGFGTAPSSRVQANLKKALRESMNAFTRADKDTSARKNVNPEQQSASSKETPKEQEGYDPAQPTSQAKMPGKKAETPTPEPATPEEEVRPAESVIPEVPEQEITVDTPSDDELAKNVIDESPKVPVVDEEDEEKVKESKSNKPKIPYYRTSIPEIETGQAKAAREAIMFGNIEGLKMADLSDFVQWKRDDEGGLVLNDNGVPVATKNEGYSDMYYALQLAGAFDYIATDLKAGDEIEFVISDKFPTYKGEKQILMTVVRPDGTRQILNILSGQTSKYYNLSALRSAIWDEYNAWSRNNPSGDFVFSKKSRVYKKVPGLMRYDYSKAGETAIKNTPAYSDEAPIVFIDRFGNAQVVRGDKDAADHVSTSFNNPEVNLKARKAGNLYYLAKTNISGNWYYQPIRLGVEHFNKNTSDSDNLIIARIRTKLDGITKIVQDTNSDNITEQSEKLRKALGELGKDLDIRDIYMELDDYPTVGVALKVVTNWKSQERAETEGEEASTGEQVFRRNDQITENWLLDLVAEQNKPIQVTYNNGKISNIGELVDSGVITSNATLMRPVGTDFWIDPWDNESKTFEPLTEEQKQTWREQNMKQTSSVSEEETPSVSNSGIEPEPDMQSSPEESDHSDRAEKHIVKDTPENTVEPISYPGDSVVDVSEQEWDTLSREEKEMMLTCRKL